jgi:hypothetical protein
MFGRKRKKDEDSVGLAGLGTGGVSPSLTPTQTVNVTAQPFSDPEPPAAAEPPAADEPPAAPDPAMLGQILSGHGPVGELVAQIRSNPEAFRQQMMSRLQAAGYSPVTLSVQTGAQMGAGTQMGAGPSQSKPVDVIEELTKAADLHHKGVLSDAEFEAYKKKLLAE